MAESGYARPALPQLIARVRADVAARFQGDEVLRRSDAEVYGRALAAAVHSVYGFIDYLARNILPDQADEDWLARHASLVVVPRKQAVAATGYARFDGVADGLSVPAASIMLGPSGVEYVVTATAYAAAGILRAPITCSQVGLVGNLDDGVQLQMTTPVPGLTTTPVADSVGAGADLEPIDDWRARVCSAWANEEQGGNVNDYERWALEVPGVARAKCLPALAGAGTVTVGIMTASVVDPSPDLALLSAAFSYIDAKRPAAGKGLFVEAPVLVPFSPSIRLRNDSPELRLAVVDALREFFYKEGVLGGFTLSLSRVREAISLTAGEYAHDMPVPASDPVYAALQLPILGTITWLT